MTPSGAGRVDPSRVTAAVRHMVGSVEPSRVFSELAQVCVPAVADACTIDLVEEGGHRYRIRHPPRTPMAPGDSLNKIWWRRPPSPPTGLAVHGSPVS